MANFQEKVLVIEDDPDILELLQYNLQREGYEVHWATRGEQGLSEASRHKPGLILLDLMLPGMNGLDVCRALRHSVDTQNTPIIMLTAKGEESDIVLGLELGADDYVTKPFSPRELLARVRSVLRRSRSDDSATQVHAVGPLTLDESRHEVSLRGERVVFTLAEFNLLKALMARPGLVLTREQLLDSITGGDVVVIDRNVDVHVRAIRKKLGDYADLIATVRGIGYKCAPPASLVAETV